MLPHVVLARPHATSATLYPGDLIGRLPSAALVIDDPYVSEAHCMVSLRGARLWLVGLRGGMRLRDQRTWRSELELKSGQLVQLAQSTTDPESPSTLAVAKVVLPTHVLAVVGVARHALPLDRPEWSFFLDPLRAQPGLRPDAAARLWRTHERWSFQGPSGERVPVGPGDGVQVGQHHISFEAVPASEVPGTPRTGAAPLRLSFRPDSTEVASVGRPAPVLFRGNAHQILLQTAILTQRASEAVHWRDVASGIWSSDPLRLEKNWTKGLRRLKDALEERGLPRDLVTSESGYVSLGLREGVDKVQFLDGAEDWF